MSAVPQPGSRKTTRPWEKVRELTGRVDGPAVDVPESLIDNSHALADQLAKLSRGFGEGVSVHPADLLTERADLLGLTRKSPSSCGGGTRLIQALDGWVAIAMTRADDAALLPAWLGDSNWPEWSDGVSPDSTFTASDSTDLWSAIESAISRRAVTDLVSFGAEIGLAVSALGEVQRSDHPNRTGFSSKPRTAKTLRVVELASLWAGPLCGRLLSSAGAEVVKLESVERPDGARSSPGFFRAMHSESSFHELRFSTQAGRDELLHLVRNADVVIEGSRPRALHQLGVHPEELLCDTRSRVSVWVSITGHGRSGTNSNRVGFGDDAAIAGGLATWDELGPLFIADACADPLAGLAAATEVLDLLSEGGSWLLDLSLSSVAASMTAIPTAG